MKSRSASQARKMLFRPFIINTSGVKPLKPNVLSPKLIHVHFWPYSTKFGQKFLKELLGCATENFEKLNIFLTKKIRTKKP